MTKGLLKAAAHPPKVRHVLAAVRAVSPFFEFLGHVFSALAVFKTHPMAKCENAYRKRAEGRQDRREAGRKPNERRGQKSSLRRSRLGSNFKRHRLAAALKFFNLNSFFIAPFSMPSSCTMDSWFLIFFVISTDFCLNEPYLRAELLAKWDCVRWGASGTLLSGSGLKVYLLSHW